MKTSISILGRLLEEISWEGNARHYRKGGRGQENVLTVEVFQALELLSRKQFLGNIIKNLHGADVKSKDTLSREIEAANFSMLPGDIFLNENPPKGESRLSLQPDGVIETNSVFGLIEIKRLKSGSFQEPQMARQFLAVLQEAYDKHPLLILIIPKPPPIPVKGNGRMSIRDSIMAQMETTLERCEQCFAPLDELERLIDEVVCWITWDEIYDIIKSELQNVDTGDSSIDASVCRTGEKVITAIDWHR